jgi:hypothetical protein
MPLDQQHEKEKHEEKSLSPILNNFDSWHNAYEILQKFNRYPKSTRITKDYLFLILLIVVIKTTIKSIRYKLLLTLCAEVTENAKVTQVLRFAVSKLGYCGK